MSTSLPSGVFATAFQAASATVLPIAGNDLRMTRNARTVLDVSAVTLGQASCTAIIGPNGAGKSLLLRTLGGLLVPDSGSVRWGDKLVTDNGHSTGELSRSQRLAVGFVTQRPSLLARTALQNMDYALRARGLAAAKRRTGAMKALEVAGLSAIAHTPAPRLSAGEQQRLALTRALALEPAILLLDEPTANVDPVSTAPFERMLKEAVASGLRMVIVSHDLNQVRRLADEVLLMNQGRVVEQQPVAPFFESPASEDARRWLAGELLV